MEALDGLVKAIDKIDLVKTEQKVIKYVAGFLLGYFMVDMASKFVSDNWSFRINRISNLPPDSVNKTE